VSDTAKSYGDVRVFWPIDCVTGALHAQPNSPAVEALACSSFTDDYKTWFDHRGFLDATECIPSGGVRALDFQAPASCRLMVANVWREGHRA
jgi:hypothetical protein